MCVFISDAGPSSPPPLVSSIIAMAAANVDALRQPEVITEFTRVLRTNERVCLTVGASFAKQMGHLYADLLNCYAAFSNFISTTCVQRDAGWLAVCVMCLACFERLCVFF